MILLCEIETSFLKSLAIELTGMFENLAYCLDVYMLRKDLLNTTLD